jgi:hypothetical protein
MAKRKKNKDNYKINLEAMKQINPDYANWLENESDTNWITLIKSKNNDSNFIVRQDGKVFPAYSMESARKQARETVKNINFYNEEVTVMIGLGLGHLLNQVRLKKEKNHHIVMIEPTAQLVREAFKLYNFSKEILDLKFLFAKDEAGLNEIFNLIESIFVKSEWHISMEKFVLSNPDKYNKLIEKATGTINQIMCNTGTVQSAGSQIADNDIINLPYIIRHRGVAELKDLYKNKPAILVSTGPSLSKNIHRLKDIQDKVIIIAVAQALRVLLAYDITPDFICTVDFGKVNIDHFKGLMGSTVPLIALNRTYAPILKQWQGPKFIVGTPVPGYSNTTVGVIEKKGSIEQGGSVAHLCLGAAINLGCNPIGIIGQDLSYPNNEDSHIRTVDAGGHIEVENGIIQWIVDDPRSELKGKKKIKKYSHGPAQYVPGYFGDMVLTNLGLASFITSFNNIMKHYDNDFYNCTEGGAKLSNCKQMTLKKYLKTFCTKKIDKTVLQPLLSLVDDSDKLISETIPLIEKDIELLTELITVSGKGIKPTEKIKNNENLSEKEIRELLDNNYDCAVKALALAKQNNLIGVAIYNSSRIIHQRKYAVPDRLNLPKNKDKRKEKYTKHLVESREDLLTRVEASELILKTTKKSATRLKKLYKNTLTMLKEYQKTGNEDLLVSREAEEINLNDVDKYFEVGNWAHPLVDARKFLCFQYSNNKTDSKNNVFSIATKKITQEAEKIQFKAIEMRQKEIDKAEEWAKKEDWDKLIKYNELIDHAQKHGRKTQNFEEVLMVLKEAIIFMPDRFEARWGIATTSHLIGKVEEAKKEYKKLIEEFPKNHRLRFEYGLVLIKNKKTMGEGIKTIIKAMGETKEYDYWFSSLGDLYRTVIKQYDKAILAYQQYLELFPADYEVMLDMAFCYEKLGDTNKKDKMINMAKRIKPDLKIS